ATVGPTGRPVRNFDSHFAGHFAHRGGILHAEFFHEEGEDVSTFVTDEAVIHPLLGDDRKIAMRAAVEGACPAVIRAGAPQRHKFADDRDQVGGVADTLDDFFRDHAHASSAMVTPVPPCGAGASWNPVTRRSALSICDTRARNAPVPLP